MMMPLSLLVEGVSVVMKTDLNFLRLTTFIMMERQSDRLTHSIDSTAKSGTILISQDFRFCVSCAIGPGFTMVRAQTEYIGEDNFE